MLITETVPVEAVGVTEEQETHPFQRALEKMADFDKCRQHALEAIREAMKGIPEGGAFLPLDKETYNQLVQEDLISAKLVKYCLESSQVHIVNQFAGHVHERLVGYVQEEIFQQKIAFGLGRNQCTSLGCKKTELDAAKINKEADAVFGNPLRPEKSLVFEVAVHNESIARLERELLLWVRSSNGASWAVGIKVDDTRWPENFKITVTC